MVANIDFDICAIIISFIVIGCMLVLKDMKRMDNKLLLAAVGAGLVCAALDIASVFADSDAQCPLLVKYLLCYAYLILHNLSCPLVYVYITRISGAYYKRKKSKYAFIMLPIAAELVLYLINPFTDWVFYYDAEKIYRRGELMNLVYVIAFFYAILFTIHLFRYIRAIPMKRVVMLVLFFLSGGGTIVYQYFYPHIKIELFVQAVVYIAILISIEDENALYDTGTMVYNRDAFFMDTKRLIASDNHFGVTIVKLTNLNSYSYVLGMEQVRRSMRNMAAWLKEISWCGNVYDIGWGVFAMEFAGEAKEKMPAITDAIRERFQSTFTLDDIDIAYEAQIIEAEVPEDFSKLEHILLLGEQPVEALAKGKVLRGDGLALIKRNIAVEMAVRRAIHNEGFQVCYQPIWDSHSKRIRSAEALVRLYDSELGYVTPEEFVRVAEKNGTIITIGEYVFTSVCKFIAANRVEELGIDYIEVNLSTVQCMQSDVAEKFTEILKKYHVDTSKINFEITETAAVENADMMAKTLRDLKKQGFTTSIDDFGTGYSNLSGIFDLNFEIIKIDKSILWKSEESAEGELLLANLIELSKRMGRKVVQEGVETKEQLDKLVRMGCDFCQGRYFASPLSEDEFLQYLQEFERQDA